MMNVQLPKPIEEFVRGKVADGEYETPDEVVREGLRLLRQRDEAWKADARSRIEQGMESIRAGRLISPEAAKAEMADFKELWRKNRATQ